jgi:hypothetical protein
MKTWFVGVRKLANVKNDDAWNFRPHLYAYHIGYGTLVKAILLRFWLTLKNLAPQTEATRGHM